MHHRDCPLRLRYEKPTLARAIMDGARLNVQSGLEPGGCRVLPKVVAEIGKCKVDVAVTC